MRVSPWIWAASLIATGLAARAANATEPAKAPAADDRESVEMAFDGAVGPALRFGESGGTNVTDRLGLSLSLGARVTPSPLFSLGLSFEHASLGREVSGAGAIDRVDLTRDANALWATAYLHVLTTESLRLAILVGPGLAWQSADAVGIREGASPWLTTSFACEGSASADLALGAGLSAIVPIGDGLSLLSEARVASYGFGTDALGTCAAGVGTTATAALRVGFSYGFDVARFVR